MTIMKKSLSLLCSLCISVLVFADGLTATLQQGDEMTPFYGVDAFNEAYQAADSGAVITLSVGNFNPSITPIEKSLTIIGASAMQSDDQYNTNLNNITIVADNVTIEGVKFSNLVNLGNIKNCHIKRSYLTYLRSLNDSSFHTNTIVEQSYVNREEAIKTGINYCIQNSYLGEFYTMNTVNNMAYITNCYINNFFGGSGREPYAIYKKNILYHGYSGTTLSSDRVVYVSSPSEFYDNVIIYYSYKYSSSKTYTFKLKSSSGTIFLNNFEVASTYTTTASGIPRPTTYLASDSTYIGPAGGMGVSDYPAIPRIVSKSIDSNTDTEGKLNISITVKAEQ